MIFVGESVTLFSRQKGEDGSSVNWLSVTGRQLGSHAVVVFDGNNSGMGSWICLKDHESTCSHVLLAQDKLQDVLNANGHHIEGWEDTNPNQGKC